LTAKKRIGSIEYKGRKRYFFFHAFNKLIKKYFGNPTKSPNDVIRRSISLVESQYNQIDSQIFPKRSAMTTLRNSSIWERAQGLGMDGTILELNDKIFPYNPTLDIESGEHFDLTEENNFDNSSQTEVSNRLTEIKEQLFRIKIYFRDDDFEALAKALYTYYLTDTFPNLSKQIVLKGKPIKEL
jgi:hypothetical protein